MDEKTKSSEFRVEDLPHETVAKQKRGVKRKRTVVESGEPRKKRVRTNYTKEHLQQLEAVFAQTQYPDLLLREQIAEQLKVTEQKIHIWFQNRRAKQRKLGRRPATQPLPHQLPAAEGKALLQHNSNPAYHHDPALPMYFPLTTPLPVSHSPAIGMPCHPPILDQVSFAAKPTAPLKSSPYRYFCHTQYRPVSTTFTSVSLTDSQVMTPSPQPIQCNLWHDTPPLSAERPATPLGFPHYYQDYNFELPPGLNYI